MQERNKKLKNRVLKAREDLSNLDVKKPVDEFSVIYPEYIKGADSKEKIKAKTRLRNLFYCKTFDEDFTRKIELFVKQIKN